MKIRRKKLIFCTVCRGKAVPICYGFPSGAMVKAAERGVIILGGCIIDAGNPSYWCESCDGYLGITEEHVP